MKLLYLETKKIILNRFVIGALIGLLIINGLFCLNQIDRITAGLSDRYLDARNTIYEQVEGSISEEKLSFIISEKERLNGIIVSGQYSTEPDQPGTHTGFIYSDNNLFNDLYNEIKYTFQYSRFSDSVVEKAKSNVKFFYEKQNKYETEKYSRMAEAFKGRSITRYFRTQGWDEYFNYSFSSLSILLLVLAGVSPVLSRERETKMDSLLYITKSGIRSSLAVKIVVAFIYTGMITSLFCAQDFILFSAGCSLKGFANPLYALPSFQDTPLNMSIFQFILFNYFLKMIGSFAFCSIVLLGSSIANHDIGAIVNGTVLLVISIAAGTLKKSALYIILLNASYMFKSFTIKSFLDFAVMPIELIVAGSVLFTVCCIGMSCIIETARSRYPDWTKVIKWKTS